MDTWNVATTASVVAVSACLAVMSYRIHATNRAYHQHRILAGDSPLNRFISSRLRPVVDRFTPTWWTNTHLQIALTFLVPSAGGITYERELLAMSDGGHITLDWTIPSSDKFPPLSDDSPIVLVLHGLTGCSASMTTTCLEARVHGYRPVAFNKRGHGGVPLATPKLQAFGCVKDMSEAIDVILDRYPNAPLYCIGYSAGSGLLCSYLGETGAESKIQAGVMVSPGYNAFELFCNHKINPIYDYLMTFSLKSFLRRHRTQLDGIVDYDKAMAAKSIREFDEHVYMGMHGYDDLEAYWKDNNPMRDWKNVDVPVLCINAADDPVCTSKTIPMEAFEGHPSNMLILTSEGSHCAFYQGHFFLKSWVNEASIKYLDAFREFKSNS